MERLAKIYTRSGDEGKTYCVMTGGRVSKDHPAIEAVGTLDELNSAIGLARAVLEDKGYTSYSEILGEVQRDLFMLGYSLTGRSWKPDTARLEQLIDKYMHGIKLEGFIIPGGSTASAIIHYARTVCRRFERRLVSLKKEGISIDRSTLAYVNRLSDLLFAMAVRIAADEGKLEYAPRQL